MTTLRNWSPRIAQMLAHVYRNRQFDTGDPAQSATVRALQALGDCLERQQEIAADDALVVPVSAGDAILFTVKQLSSMPIPAAAEDMAVEIAGWLEAPLDDAPVLVIAGMNEGFLPRSVSADAFLPNRMRAALGLVDNSARYARDSYLLCAAAHSRGENLHVVCGRVTADGDPLRPSRLLFACEEDAMVRRALRFYEDKNDPSPSMPLLHYGTDYDLATISLPRTLAKPIARISVTAFATYLACPYRFYLQRLVGLDAPNEQCDEMDGAMFGSLAHEVFRRFGGAPIKYSTDRDEIERFLGDALVDASRDQFGTDLLPAVEIQLRQLKMRLDCFAQLQARIAGEGWKILYAEHDLGLDVPIDGVPTAIVGKVDRIDYNRDLDRYRLIDYKTGDAGDSPEATHRKTKDGLKTWVGLQLPLYQRMAAQALKIDASKIEVGYILLPKHVDKAGYKAAEWTADEFQSAYDVAVSVLHDIRHEKFWPPSESVPAYPDGLETICMDLCPDRPAIVRNSTGVMAEWKRGRA